MLTELRGKQMNSLIDFPISRIYKQLFYSQMHYFWICGVPSLSKTKYHRAKQWRREKKQLLFSPSFVIASTIIEHTWIQVAEARGAAVCNSWPYEPRWDLDSSTNHSSRVTNVSSNCEHLYSRSESAFEIEDESSIWKTFFLERRNRSN